MNQEYALEYLNTIDEFTRIKGAEQMTAYETYLNNNEEKAILTMEEFYQQYYLELAADHHLTEIEVALRELSDAYIYAARNDSFTKVTEDRRSSIADLTRPVISIPNIIVVVMGLIMLTSNVFRQMALILLIVNIPALIYRLLKQSINRRLAINQQRILEDEQAVKDYLYNNSLNHPYIRKHAGRDSGSSSAIAWMISCLQTGRAETKEEALNMLSQETLNN